ncbi:MAG: hypothetical protein H0S85_09445 [Desulfovibrionaceae bacterium]|jgi:hypothetical protein|nr:hypothetical protein [Desulfovibrionaceae bacterium]
MRRAQAAFALSIFAVLLCAAPHALAADGTLEQCRDGCALTSEHYRACVQCCEDTFQKLREKCDATCTKNSICDDACREQCLTQCKDKAEDGAAAPFDCPGWQAPKI